MSFTKKDYLSYGIISTIFILCTFSFKELFQSNLLAAVGGALGGICGYFVSLRMNSQSKRNKILLLIGLLILFVASMFLVTKNTKSRSVQEFSGIWKTDSVDGYIIKLRFWKDSVYLSSSPEYEEVGYTYKTSPDSLILERKKTIRFAWRIVEKNETFFTASDDEEEIKFFFERGNK